MNQLFTYKVSLLLQGMETSTLSISAASQEEADNILRAAAQENRMSSFIDDSSAETEIDYETVRFLEPEQADGNETIRICRDKECIYSNQPNSDLYCIQRKLVQSREYDLTNDEGKATVIEFEKNLPIPAITLNEEGIPCAVVPLSCFSDETIALINEIM